MKWIVLGEDWNSHPSSTQHLFKRLVQQEPVVWVNSIGLRSPKLNRHDMARIYSKGKSLLFANSKAPAQPVDKPTDIGSQPQVIAPRVLPFHQYQWVRYLNSFSLRQQIHSTEQAQNNITKSTKELAQTIEPNSTNKILWLSLPSAVDLIGKCNEQLSVYYCGDDFSALAGVDHKVIAKLEAELIEKCDVIFAASQSLKDKFPAHKSYLLEHGVDYDLFQQPKPKPDNFPTGKVMGFYGQLADWVDIELLERVADAFPDWHLMLIGKIDTDTRDLLTKANVHHLPAMAHDELAAYAQHWDIALLPFKHCQQIEYCNPLKLREYLATGTRIVSTAFQAAQTYRQHINLVNPQDDFIAVIKQTIEHAHSTTSQGEEERKRSQQTSVIKASWEQRAKDVQVILRSHLNTLHFNNLLNEVTS
ncbi:glycosyltransferase [Marinomonas transparens]|uniref:Glycosyltransferase family 1 protein n=1 Tax=Marinomonas transparens TaxID=2795388 RepID=A0A934N1Z9_9GAMM|nr:glycosyltransferase [Marinomonas transparens]MBJ7538252.1 glycosyltransferase family 1 protein [Marinomonas transparens]